MTIKKAVLLSAGFGTRLKPITDNLPKCLVPINGKALLQIWLEELSEAGFNEFLINTHYLPEQVHEFIENSPFKKKITLFHEDQLLGTLGTLQTTQAFWQNDDVLVAHADNLCFCDWQSFKQSYRNKPSDCFGTMMLFETDTPSLCGIVELDEDRRVIEFHEKVAKPPSHLASAAIYLFNGTMLTKKINQLPSSASDISLDLIPNVLGQLNSWQTNGYLRDIGNIESLTIANEYVACHKH